MCHLIRGFSPKFYSQISNSKLKCNRILVVRNDHMYDLVNMGNLLTCRNVSLVNFDGLAHMFIRCSMVKKNPSPFLFILNF
jgi:hypothetical protein